MLIFLLCQFPLCTQSHTEGPSSSALTKGIRNNLYTSIKDSAQHVLHEGTPVPHTLSQCKATVSFGGSRKRERHGNLQK